MIRLHAHPYSLNSRKIHWALEEIGVPYEFVVVDILKGAHKQPTFTALNPHARVPVLEDGDFTLYESNAILQYLASQYGKGDIGGRDARETALVNQWLFVQAFDLQPGMQKAFVHKLYASFGQPFDAEAHSRCLTELPPGLAVLEAHLKERRYLVGEHLTIADLAVAEPIGVADYAGVDLTAYPHIRAWYGGLAERPAFQKTRPKG